MARPGPYSPPSLNLEARGRFWCHSVTLRPRGQAAAHRALDAALARPQGDDHEGAAVWAWTDDEAEGNAARPVPWLFFPSLVVFSGRGCQPYEAELLVGPPRPTTFHPTLGPANSRSAHAPSDASFTKVLPSAMTARVIGTVEPP